MIFFLCPASSLEFPSSLHQLMRAWYYRSTRPRKSVVHQYWIRQRHIQNRIRSRSSFMWCQTGNSCAELTPCSPGRPVSGRQTTRCSAAGRRKRAKRPGQFEVQVVTPPTQSLGVHALPPDTHNGDMIEIHDQQYVVQSLVIQFKLVKGRYQRDHHRLDCVSAARSIINRSLEHTFANSGRSERK